MIGTLNRTVPKTDAQTSVTAPVGYWDARLQLFLLLILATVLDYLTGPAISAAAFYIFPVGFAGWRFRPPVAAILTAISAALNALTTWIDRTHAESVAILLASQALHLVIYAAVAYLCSTVRNEQGHLREQRDKAEYLRNQMTAEMEAARTLQKLLSEPPVRHPSVEIGTFSDTARILGGDILDVSLAENRIAVLIGDVSGKGSPAALATAVLLGMLADCPVRFHSPGQTLEFLNRRLCNRLPDAMFVTALYLLLDTETGHLLWANAGHDPPFLSHPISEHRPSVTVEEIVPPDGLGGLPLSIMDGTTYSEHCLPLRQGEVLLCYTDGLSNFRQPSGKDLGYDRIQTLFTQCADLPCQELIATLLRNATGRDTESLETGDWEDDISLLALRLSPGARDG
jgi:phosphoserine phosphatase RsbU/P